MTNRERVLALIRSNPMGLTDSEVREGTGIQPHQQVNQICRTLEQAGCTKRVEGPKGRIINIPNDALTNEAESDRDSGLEPEQEDSSEIRRPFDPEKIKIRTVNPVITQIAHRA